MRPSSTNVLLARAFDPSVQPPDDATSGAILDAAAGSPPHRHRQPDDDDVARKARVGRMTVYRRFGDKPSLVEAMIVREVRRSCTSSIAPLLATRPRSISWWTASSSRCA